MLDVVTFGEMMVVFNPAKMGSLTNVHQFYKSVGGAEANVAIGLQRLGRQAGFFTKLGNDSFGENILNFLRSEGVDTSQIKFDAHFPTGIYFKEMRNTDMMNVYYYRSNSAASTMSIDNLDENYIKKAKYLHVTGITPFLSTSCEDMVFEAIRLAKKHNVLISFDPNIRYKLMKNKSEGKTILQKLSSLADMIMPGIDEGQFITGKETPEAIADELILMGTKNVVIKLGEAGAYYKTQTDEKYVKAYPVRQVVDSVGAGDGFAAGLLTGLLKNDSFEKAVELGNCVGAMSVICEGDIEGLPTMDVVNRFLNKETDIVR